MFIFNCVGLPIDIPASNQVTPNSDTDTLELTQVFFTKNKRYLGLYMR